MGKRYKKSPIIEALCEFRFAPDATWDLTVLGLVYEKVKGIFPKHYQVAPLDIGIVSALEGVGQGGGPLVRFASENEKLLVQVGQNLLTVNHLKPYSSWEKFLPLIEQGLAAYRESADPTGIQQVGLRYINRIDFASPRIQLEDYFELRPFAGQKLPQDFDALVVGVQIPYEDLRDSLRIRLASRNTEVPDTTALILEIGYFLTDPEKASLDTLLEWVDVAHKHVEEAFEGCITDLLRQQFEEVQE